MTLLFASFATSAALVAGTAAVAQETPSAPDAKVYFINLADGASVKSPFLVQFGLSGMGIAPAGSETENTGHHHLLIDASLEGEALKAPIDMDDNHRHFGKGQTEAMIELPPGTHTLQMVLGDWTHIPHATPVMSDALTITVE